jgi:hypothetical protein
MGLREQLEDLIRDQIDGGDAELIGLITDPVVDASPIHADDKGANQTWLITLGGLGDQGYFKPMNGTNASLASLFGLEIWEVALCEASAWQVASQLGPPWTEIVPRCGVRPIEEVDERAPGSICAQRFGDRQKSLEAILYQPELCLAGAFFDAVIGNLDRSIANVLYAPNREEVSLIDHGFAFPVGSRATMNQSVLLDWRHRLGLAALTDAEASALERLRASDNAFGVVRYLGSDRANAMLRRAETMQRESRLLLSSDVVD